MAVPLGLVQVPGGRQDAAVFAGVRIAEHDLLPVAGGA